MNIFVKVLQHLLAFAIRALVALEIIFSPTRWFRKRKNIAGKTVLITGAGGGLGRQLAVEFSKLATRLVLVDIDRKALLQTERLLERQSPVFIYDCDVSDYKKVYEMADRVRADTGGGIDILVNNAGIVIGKRLEDLPEEGIIKVMGVNALAHFWMCKAFLPAMMEQNYGHIVSIASIAGKMTSDRNSDYCASKYAAVAFAECLEKEMVEKGLDGIHVTVVCPLIIDTGMFKGAKITIAPVMTPQYVAQKVVAGVLENADTIFLPYYMKYIYIFLQFLPRRWQTKLMEITGNSSVMKDFTGRSQNGHSQSLHTTNGTNGHSKSLHTTNGTNGHSHSLHTTNDTNKMK